MQNLKFLKKMKILIVCFISIFISLSQSFAQDENKGVARRKHEIAFDLSGSSIIPSTSVGNYFNNYFNNYYNGRFGYYNYNQANGASLFYRRYKISTNKQKTYERYFGNRYRLGIYFLGQNQKRNISSNTNTFYSNVGVYPIADASLVYVRIGKEIQEKFGKFQLHYGVDLVLDYYSSDYSLILPNYELQTGNLISYDSYIQKVSAISAGISPLIGIKYFLNSRILFSLESNFDILYRTSNLKDNFARVDLVNNTTSSTEANNDINAVVLKLSPIFTIMLGFHF